MNNVPNKACDLDPLPSWLLNKYVSQLLPLITAVISWSIDELVMRLCLKRTSITPLLVKYGLEKDNLPFNSKSIEKVVAMRIEEHLDHNDVNDSY